MLRGIGSCGHLSISHVTGLIIGLFYPFIQASAKTAVPRRPLVKKAERDFQVFADLKE